MYTDTTYQDWLATARDGDEARRIVQNYRSSAFFKAALEANRYFDGENPTLDDKYLLRIQTRESVDAEGMTVRRAEQHRVVGNRVSSSFLRRFICQENQYLLGNGVTLESA